MNILVIIVVLAAINAQVYAGFFSKFCKKGAPGYEPIEDDSKQELAIEQNTINPVDQNKQDEMPKLVDVTDLYDSPKSEPKSILLENVKTLLRIATANVICCDRCPKDKTDINIMNIKMEHVDEKYLEYYFCFMRSSESFLPEQMQFSEKFQNLMEALTGRKIDKIKCNKVVSKSRRVQAISAHMCYLNEAFDPKKLYADITKQKECV